MKRRIEVAGMITDEIRGSPGIGTPVAPPERSLPIGDTASRVHGDIMEGPDELADDLK